MLFGCIGMIKTIPNPTDNKPGYYYVSVIDGDNWGLLLGHFDTFNEASKYVKQTAQLAHKADSKAHFYNYGVCRVPLDSVASPPVGRLNALTIVVTIKIILDLLKGITTNANKS